MVKKPSPLDYTIMQGSGVIASNDERQLHHFHWQVSEAFKSSPLNHNGAHDHICNLIVKDILPPSNINPDLSKTTTSVIAGLMSMDPLLFSAPKPIEHEDARSFAAITAKDRDLTTKAEHLEKFDQHFTFWTQTIKQMLAPIIQVAPKPSSPQAGSLNLTQPLHNFTADIQPIIDNIVHLLANERLSELRFFRLLYLRLRENTLKHYGLTLAQLDAKNPAAIACRHKQLFDDMSHHEAIDILFSNTPLGPIFNTPIAIAIPEEPRFEHTLIVAGHRSRQNAIITTTYLK